MTELRLVHVLQFLYRTSLLNSKWSNSFFINRNTKCKLISLINCLREIREEFYWPSTLRKPCQLICKQSKSSEALFVCNIFPLKFNNSFKKAESNTDLIQKTRDSEDIKDHTCNLLLLSMFVLLWLGPVNNQHHVVMSIRD